MKMKRFPKISVLPALIFASTISGCGTSKLNKDEQLALIESRTTIYGSDSLSTKQIVESKPIFYVNGKKNWPALPQAKTAPGVTSVQLQGDCPKGNLLLCRSGEIIEFNTAKGRRYEIAPMAIYSSDATQSLYLPKGKTLFRSVILTRDKNTAVIQSVVDSITGEDATKTKNGISNDLAVVELRYGTPLSQMEQVGNIFRSGNLSGLNWWQYSPRVGKVTAIVMSCNPACRLFSKYALSVEPGKRYELAPNGVVYVSNAYIEPSDENRVILSNTEAN